MLPTKPFLLATGRRLSTSTTQWEQIVVLELEQAHQFMTSGSSISAAGTCISATVGNFSTAFLLVAGAFASRRPDA